MSTSTISVPRSRKGISTILGVIIFVGLLFSSVLPTYLVMREADTTYDKEVFELRRLDDERAREKLYVYAYPDSSNVSQLKIRVMNRCDLDIKILRVWINDDYKIQNTIVSAMMDKDLGTFPVVLIDGTYYLVKLTTERGNVFTSVLGSLYYFNGTWYTSELSICINIQNDQGQYKITVDNDEIQFHYTWFSDGIIHYDFIKSVNVTESVYTPSKYI